MKHHPQLFLMFALSLVFGAAGASQAQNKACPVPPPSPYKHTAYIATRYDASGDLMRTVLEHPTTLGSETEPLYLTASFAYVDAARTKIEFALVSVAPAARFRERHQLRVFADGRELPRLAPETYRAGSDDVNGIIELTQISLSSAALSEVAKARRVQVSLGAVRVELTEDHLESLRELLSLVRPPAFAAAEGANRFPLPTAGY